MQVKNGSSSAVEMTNEQAEEAMRSYFAEHGINFEYICISEDGEIQFKMPTGFKVIIGPGKYEGEHEIHLC